jgi:hypothetical protein
VAYTSHNEKTGEGTDLFVQAFPATGIAHQLRVERLANAPSSTPHKPVWSHDGRELFYVPRLGGFEVVRVQTTPVFSFGPPVALPRPFSPGAPTFRTLFDLMADGRFVGVVPVGAPEDLATATPGIQVVLDWFDELHEKVPL